MKTVGQVGMLSPSPRSRALGSHPKRPPLVYRGITPAHGRGSILWWVRVRTSLPGSIGESKSANRPGGRAWKELSLNIACAGTPHRGSPVASPLATLSERFITDYKGHPGLDHRKMQITNESWLHISQKYTVVNFYETLPTNRGISRTVFSAFRGAIAHSGPVFGQNIS